jgi:hypothetical protein
MRVAFSAPTSSIAFFDGPARHGIWLHYVDARLTQT